MVVDVDEGAAFETEESGAVDAVAFEQDGGSVAVGVDVVCGGGVVDAIQVGKGAVGGGNGVGEDDIDLTAELVEYLGEGKDGADGVAVGAGVRGEEKARVSTEGCNQSGDLALMRLGLVWLERRLKFVKLSLRSHDLAVSGC